MPYCNRCWIKNDLILTGRKRPQTQHKIRNSSNKKPKKIQYPIHNRDKAYDTEPIKNCINEEIKALDQIPLKANFKHGWYRRLSQKIFKKEIYSKKNNVKSIFSVIKRKFGGINKSKSTRGGSVLVLIFQIFYHNFPIFT